MSKISKLFIKISLKTIGLLPLSVNRLLGKSVGWLIYTTNSRPVKITRANLLHCYPQLTSKEIEARTQSSITETTTMALETAAIWTRPVDWTHKNITKINHQELVSNALASGRGVLILAPHIGNWEALGFYLTELGSVTNMYQKPKVAALEEIIVNRRQLSGATLVPTSRRGLTHVLKALKRGEISGILPDQTPKEDHSGIFVNFFNQPAYTMTLIHKLLQKSDAVAIFAYAKRVKDGFEIVFQAAPESINSESEKESVQALSDGIQSCVEAIPTQYQWEYKRFKKAPEGNSSIY